MNKLQKILTDITPTYEYRVKFAFEPSHEMMSKITSRLMDKYDAIQVGALQKTIFQDKPLDFYNLDCGEIWMFDFKCHRGVQTNVLMYEIGDMLSVTEALIRVRSLDEPYQENIEELEDDIDFDEPVLGTDFGEPEPDGQELAGQKRIETVLKDENKRQQPLFSEYMAAGYGKK